MHLRVGGWKQRHQTLQSVSNVTLTLSAMSKLV